MKKLCANTAIYGFKDVFEKALYFFLLPVYTSNIMPNEFGVISIVILMISVLSTFTNIGQHNALTRLYYDYSCSDKKKYVSTIFVYLLIVPSLICILTYLIVLSCFNNKTMDFNILTYIPFVIMTTCLGGINDLLLTLWRLNESLKKFIVFSVSCVFVSESISLYLVVHERLGALGKLTGSLVSLVIFGIIAVICLYKYVGVIFFSKKMLLRSILFGLPLIPHILSIMILSISDRYLLKQFTDMETVGVYSVGYAFGSIVLMLGVGFGQAWGPFFYSTVNKQGSEILFSKVSTYFYVSVMIGTLVISIFAKEILCLGASVHYYKANNLIPIIALGSLFYCLYYFPVFILYYFKKTKLISAITFMSALINIMLNIYLIPKYGMIGSAISTVISYLIMLLIVVMISQSIYFMNYEYKKFVIVAFLISFAFYLNKNIFCTLDTISVDSIIIKISTVLGVVIAVLAFRVVDSNEFGRVYKQIF